MDFANKFRKFSDGIDKLCIAIVVAMLAAMLCVTIAQIVCREWFRALQWSEEVCRYLLVWSTFLGARSAARDSHFCACPLHYSFLCCGLLWFPLCDETGAAGTVSADSDEIHVSVRSDWIWSDDHSCDQ